MPLLVVEICLAVVYSPLAGDNIHLAGKKDPLAEVDSHLVVV